MTQPPLPHTTFRQTLRTEYETFLTQAKYQYPEDECLKVDLHCHDHNSNIPDELWGRLLNIPETWLKTKHLIRKLEREGCDVATITNHNNARSCWEMIDKGKPILVGAEFTCFFPEYDLYIHVLAYGFSKEQELILAQKRQNVYEFAAYAHQQAIPLIVPHPLYFYSHLDELDNSLFEKLVVLFMRFEVLNGQRDLWQNQLALTWLTELTPFQIQEYARKHQLDPAEFGVDPNAPKILTGGSDCHTGIFAGQCGSYLWVPNLQERVEQGEALPDLALEAITHGRMVPFGYVAENEKLNIALLDYFAEVATHIEDPGLVRMLLHRGTFNDKASCFIISNLLLEMKKSRNTQTFLTFIHDALHGKKINKLYLWKIPKDYKFCIKYLDQIAGSRTESPEVFVDTINQVIKNMFSEICDLILKRLKQQNLSSFGSIDTLTTETLTRKFEIPTQLTALLMDSLNTAPQMSQVNVGKLLDQLTFPVFIGLVLTGVYFVSTRVLYSNRPMLNQFAQSIGRHHHDKRALYLTDTLLDKNGVSNSLSAKLKVIQTYNLDVDFLICHPTASPDDHLHVVQPQFEFRFPNYPDQPIRIPDLMQICQIFYQGGYDRIICSTEGPMLLAALFIKHMFNVPSFFFMHTDWLDFIRHTTELNRHERDRIRRLLRLTYQQFDGVFVLNSEHQKWLSGHEMNLKPEQVHLTAHHTLSVRTPELRTTKKAFFKNAKASTPILFLACRLSNEKGIMDLPIILEQVKAKLPDVRMVIAGQGPDQEALKEAMPDALFLGWVDKKTLNTCYQTFDLFLFPSQFDTFGNVILEAFVQGMPCAAYNCKGPKDIIQHQQSGYLANSREEMPDQIIHYFESSPSYRKKMKQAAQDRIMDYRAEPIMAHFMASLGLDAKGLIPRTQARSLRSAPNRQATAHA